MNDKTTKKVTTTVVAGAVLAGTLSHKLEHLDPPPEAPTLPNIAAETTIVSSGPSIISSDAVIAAFKKLDGNFKG